MKKHPMRLFYLVALFAVAACTTNNGDMSPTQTMGWAPVYSSPTIYDSIEVQGVKPTLKAGKIYASGNYIFQVDQQKGIHIVANGQSANPMKVAFLKIPFCTEVAVKGAFLYANNLDDLVVFNITDPTNPQLVKRLVDAFPTTDKPYPDAPGYFECVDPAKGLVVGWEEKVIKNPKCRR